MKIKNCEVRFEDCIEGMKSLEDQSIDLCLTDPPYNRDYKGGLQKYKEKTKSMIERGTRVTYDDHIAEYEEFSKKWFAEARRICKLVIFSPGNQNLGMWFRIEEPSDILIHLKRNGHGSTYLTWMNQFEHYLIFGKYWNWDFNQKPFRFNTIEVPILSGFLRDKEFLHPTPKPLKLWHLIIKSLNPDSVLDPFLGSGTCLEACLMEGVRFIGFELEERYRSDIEYRINRSKYYRRERSIENWFSESREITSRIEQFDDKM